MEYHNHSAAMKKRFFIVFISTFVIIFSVLNIRFAIANIRFWVAPGTITTDDTLGDAIRLLPLSENIQFRPLPDKARLVIDSIGVNAPIVFNVPNNNDSIYDNLESGVVHYSTTQRPGIENPGISLILGHSSAYPWYRGNYGSVFALIGKLKPGDKFYVQYEDNRVFVYEVKQSVVFNPFDADDPKLAEIERSREPSLVLVSCWPVGTNYRRIAVHATLVEI
jgi:LPXTG-site transpeptidase (sortase) family protein